MSSLNGGEGVGRGASVGGAAAVAGEVALKKGPWTAAEDALLTEYVSNFGARKWNAVQKNMGLARCGKSCRLRWKNHLRPDLKKGAFSSEEEKIIVKGHAEVGNKWAQMVASLPGRTDNDIKNYWKRRQRQGLPVYSCGSDQSQPTTSAVVPGVPCPSSIMELPSNQLFQFNNDLLGDLLLEDQAFVPQGNGFLDEHIDYVDLQDMYELPNFDDLWNAFLHSGL